MNKNLFNRLGLAATVLALFVVVLGAYVRLSDAGLGCPDWPGCYGQILVPEHHSDVNVANQAYPERPVEAAKAWKEMVHRYFAGTLGLLILAIAIRAWIQRKERQQQVKVPIALVGLVIFQALLGMWTVTLLLKPVVVMAHLIGGMSVLGLLWWVTIRHAGWLSSSAYTDASFRRLALIGMVIVALQIMLGGWTSANYAAVICPDFPTCQNSWLPPMDFANGFTLWRGLGVDYEGGVLGNDARVAIHVTHRIGAVITFVYLLWLGVQLLRKSQDQNAQLIAGAMITGVCVQFLLGVGNVLFSLPLPIAVAHNGVAALLLLTMVSLNHNLRSTAGRL